MARKRFLTPPTLPEDTQCRGLVIPSSREWLGLYSEALLALTHDYNYEQAEPTDLTPEATAALAYAQYVAWLNSECGGGGGSCVLPDLAQPFFRTSPTTRRWEMLENGAWVEPSGTYALPEPEARTEPTDAEKQCGAASNAVHALKTLYGAIVEVYDDEVEPALNQVEIAAQIAVAWGQAFGPVSSTFLAMSGAAWEGFTFLLGEIAEDDWTEEFQDILVCLLKSNSEVTAGKVHFNFQAVIYDLVGFVLPVIDNFVRVRWQVWYLLQCIGEQGLDLAGATNDVEGDCVTCDSWCVEATPADFGVNVVRGWIDSAGTLFSPFPSGIDVYGTLDVDTSKCQITRLGVYYHINGGHKGAIFMAAGPSNGPLSQTWYDVWGGLSGWRFTDDRPDWYSTPSESTHLEFYVGSGTSQCWIERIMIVGTGTNPFAIGSNC
jgi:hypothetical protein